MGFRVTVFETSKNIDGVFTLYNPESTIGAGVIKGNPNDNG